MIGLWKKLCDKKLKARTIPTNPRQNRLVLSCNQNRCLGAFCKNRSIWKMFTMWYPWRFSNNHLFLDLFASLAGDQKVNLSFSQKVFPYFLENVSLIYQFCQFEYFTRSLGEGVQKNLILMLDPLRLVWIEKYFKLFKRFGGISDS
jgi:hypothetical protein